MAITTPCQAAEDRIGQAAIENRPERQPGHDPLQHTQEHIGDEPVGDGIGVDHSPAARREQLDSVEGIQSQKLKSHQQSAQHRSAHEDQGSHEMPVDQALVDQVAVARQFLFQGRFLILVQIDNCCKNDINNGPRPVQASPLGLVQEAVSVSRRYGWYSPSGYSSAMVQPKTRWVAAATHHGRNTGLKLVIQLPGSPSTKSGCNHERIP